ncbi:MAG: hypothetical protein SGBAC_011816 [Bacillariaceae sp.]
MNRARHNRIIKIKRTRDGSIHKILKPIQPRVRIVSIRKRKVSNDDSFASKTKRVRLSVSNEDTFGGKRKRIRLSESRAMNRIVLPYESTKASTDKHLLFFKAPLPKLDA